MAHRIDLLPREMLIKTGPVDEGAWHYHAVLRMVMHRRISLLLRLLNRRRFPRLLDVGYGSGILFPELSKYCDELHGIDVHGYHADVQRCLSEFGITVHLTRGSADAMPYPARMFDAVVAMSSLEFIDDIESALREISRVLVPGGAFVFVSPETTEWGDRVLRWMTGVSGEQVFRDGRGRLRRALPEFFEVDQQLTYSPLPGVVAPVYRGCRMLPKQIGPRQPIGRTDRFAATRK